MRLNACVHECRGIRCTCVCMCVRARVCIVRNLGKWKQMCLCVCEGESVWYHHEEPRQAERDVARAHARACVCGGGGGCVHVRRTCAVRALRDHSRCRGCAAWQCTVRIMAFISLATVHEPSLARGRLCMDRSLGLAAPTPARTHSGHVRMYHCPPACRGRPAPTPSSTRGSSGCRGS